MCVTGLLRQMADLYNANESDAVRPLVTAMYAAAKLAPPDEPSVYQA